MYVLCYHFQLFTDPHLPLMRKKHFPRIGKLNVSDIPYSTWDWYREGNQANIKPFSKSYRA